MAHTAEPWRPGHIDHWERGEKIAIRAEDVDDQPYIAFLPDLDGNVEGNAARIVTCVNACAGLTPEQVAAIPRLVAWFTAPASADYLDFVVPEHERLATLFPRREARA